ncbi:MAG: RluA family pseudouridine synthase, partial [Acidimicrobiales bacterium]
GIIEAPLGRSPTQRVKMAVVQGGRYSRTHYWVEERASAPLPASLVLCRLETGRTHQVRAHFVAIGHPLVGDERYCPADLLAKARKALPGLGRPWLHATRLGFAHPVSGEWLRFRSALPPDLERPLTVLGLGLGLRGPDER